MCAEEGRPVKRDHGVSVALMGIDHETWTPARRMGHQMPGGNEAVARLCRVSLPSVRHCLSMRPFPRGSLGAHAVIRMPFAAQMFWRAGPVSSGALSAWKRRISTPWNLSSPTF